MAIAPNKHNNTIPAIESLSNRSKGRIVDNPFPVKLHYMLNEVEKDGLGHIVSWQPHGRCFVVHNQKEFMKCILPCWFRQSKFSSFQRQLQLYGFRRLSKNEQDKGGYYHECFLRGIPHLCHNIKRTKIKGTCTRQPTSPETEPNFYSMPYLPGSKLLPMTNKTVVASHHVSKDPTSQSRPAIVSGCRNQHLLDLTTVSSVPMIKHDHAHQLQLIAFLNNAAMGCVPSSGSGNKF